MRVTMLLADAAQVVGGKLYILGGGWSMIGPDPAASAIALKIEVPWDQANQRHRLELVLLDDDGHPVRVAERPVTLSGEFETGRPAGVPPGTPLDVLLAISVGPMALPAGRRYVWRCSINGQSEDGWTLGFWVRRGGTSAPRGTVTPAG